jgi:threonine/homoserine efflux transporter RhtA
MDETLSETLSNGKTSGRFAEIVENMSIGYLAILLALAGLGKAWRVADRTSHPPEFVGAWMQLAAGIVWAAFVVTAFLNGLILSIKSKTTWMSLSSELRSMDAAPLQPRTD